MSDSFPGFESVYLISQFSLSTVDLMLNSEINSILYRFTSSLCVSHIEFTLLSQLKFMTSPCRVVRFLVK